nr:hypothetical protein CIT39_04905 [Bradyrhizobium symbiodeficiens]
MPKGRVGRTNQLDDSGFACSRQACLAWRSLGLISERELSMAVQVPTIVNFSADSGTLGDGVTDANVVTVWGKADANTTVTVFDGTTRLGTATTNSSGSWSFTTPKLADSTHSLTATASDGSSTSAASSALSIKVVPSVTKFVPGTDNWSNPSIIDGQGWYSENAGQSWSVTTPDSHTVRMELRAGDIWADGDSSRSEILAANSVANGDIFNASYSMTIEPGTSNVNSGLSWLSLTQMYGLNGATFSIQLKGEQMAVVVNLNEPTEEQVYIDPSAIQRGHAYSIQIQARFASDSSGYLEMWRDGVQIVDYHGVLGDPGANYNLKLGIYRGEPSAANYTMAADYSNIITSTDPAFPTPPFGGTTAPGQAPVIPTIGSLSTDSNVVGDGITNDNTLTLTGTASAGNTVKVYDGTTLLGSATVGTNGTWSFTTSALSNGKHSFSASATSAGGTSALSKALAVTVDTVAPTAPVISSSSPNASRNTVLTLSGAAEANSSVKVFDGATLLGSATANGSGAWNFTTAALSTGAHHFTATAMDAAGNSSGASSAFDVTLQAPASTPTVSSVSASGSKIVSGNGNLAAGSVVALTVKLSEAVTVAGGTPTLTLNDGGKATYTSGSGTNTLTFSYTVGAGQNTSDLTVTAVNLNAATVKGGTGVAANLTGAVSNPSGTLQIDTTAPTVASVAASGSGITAGSGKLSTGNVVTLAVKLSEAVTVAGGTPTLTLNDGGTATYTGGSGTNTLTFSHTVGAGQKASDLAVTAVNLNSATVKDGAGNAANLVSAVVNPSGTLQVNATTPTTPTVASVATSGSGITSGNGKLNAGDVVTLAVKLSEAVTVAGGTPTLTLNDGGKATYTSGSGTNTLTFSYTVGAGQNTSDLTVTAVNLNAATVKGGTGVAANLTGAVSNPSGTLQIDTTAPTVASVAASGSGITAGSGKLSTGNVVTLAVKLSEAVTVAGGTPTLTLNDGGTATYTGGSGTNTLTFSHTVGAGQKASDLAVTAVNLNSATVKDGAGNAANLVGAVVNPSGTLQVNATTPTAPSAPTTTVASVAASGTGITSGNGKLNTGDVVTLAVKLSEAVTVAGGTPTLKLNDGGKATYTSGSGTNTLTFSYTVGAGQNTSDLAVTAVNLNSATVKNSNGRSANLAGAVTNPSGTLQIDTAAPAVSSMIFSGNGLTGGSGKLVFGQTAPLTMSFSEPVTVVGGTPTLKLNDGGTATYVGGSGTNALKFSYSVGLGQNTSDLAVTAVNLNSATVKDAAGNAASLANAIINPPGTLQVDTTVHLTKAGDSFFLLNANGTGPSLKYEGTTLTSSRDFTWYRPIAAVQTETGYDVALKDNSKSQYMIVSVDNGGNWTKNLSPIVSGTDPVLKPFESVFRLDMNGDGVIAASNASNVSKASASSSVADGSAASTDGSDTVAAMKFAVPVGDPTASVQPSQKVDASTSSSWDNSALTLDHRLALFTQHIASAFPSSSISGVDGSSFGQSAWRGTEPSNLAKPVPAQQHAQAGATI